MLETPREEWKEAIDDSDEVEARRERVPLESSTADAERERLNVGLHLQLHGLHPRTSTDEPSGWLYIQVATRTTVEPRMNETVIWKLKSATEARKEMTMLKLVAKPLRMLSAYLITRAVRRPPRTWTRTVAHAQTPKFAKSWLSQPGAGPDGVASE